MSNSKTHKTGQILNVYLPTRDPLGREQEGSRPCVLIADPSEIQSLRFPLLIIAPMTTRPFADLPLYPRLKRGAGRLPMDSTVLLDQLLGYFCTAPRKGALSRFSTPPKFLLTTDFLVPHSGRRGEPRDDAEG